MSPSSEQRATYEVPPTGRDRHNVRVVGQWVTETLQELLAAGGPGARLLDVGCGEQPFRPVVIEGGGVYTGFDIEQNVARTVDVVGALDEALPSPWPGDAPPYDLVLCTEVLEHVFDLDVAFANLRTLLVPGGRLIATVPFIFPVHMEPADYHRLTPYSIARFAARHGFELEQHVRLGSAVDVAMTVLEDVSILPATRSLGPRIRVRLLRTARSWMVACLEHAAAPSVRLNSNSYLSNAFVLKARPSDSSGLAV